MAIIVGTKHDDDLNGTNNGDLILSGRGDDTIDGGAGNDILFGGKGDDSLIGGNGHDLLVGGKGDDTLVGGAGYDILIGGRGDDTFEVSLGFGTDVILDFRAGAGSPDKIRVSNLGVNDFASLLLLASDFGSHTKIEFAGGDVLILKNVSVADLDEDDFIFDGPPPGLFTENDDVIDFNNVAAGFYPDGTQYDALGGNDTVTLATNATEAAEAGFVVGTAFNAGDGDDAVTGGALDDVINGDAGNDTIAGGTGSDTINGGSGDDRVTVTDLDLGDMIDGGDDTDTFVFDLADGVNHTVNASAANVTVDGVVYSVTNFENFEFNGGDQADNITTGDGDDVLFGFGGNDIFNARGGDNVLDGGDGNDSFSVTNGSNTIDGGAGNNTLFISDGTNDVTVDLQAGTASVENGGTSTVANLFQVITGAGDDVLTGRDGQSNVLNAGAGDNTLIGGDLNDSFVVTNGSNTIDGLAGNNTLFISDGTNDVTVDLVAGTASVENGGSSTVANIFQVITGNGDDDLTGSNGQNNVLNAGAGDNDLTGGDLNDSFVVTNGSNIVDGLGGDNTLFISDGSSDVTVDLDAGTASVENGGNSTVANIFQVVTGNGDDVLTGRDGQNNVLNAGAGDNDLTGGDLSDSFVVTNGNNIVDGLAGDNTLFISDGANDVTVDLQAGTASVENGGTSTVANVFQVVTAAGDDVLTGRDGQNNVLNSGAGADSLNGGDDIDVLNGGSGSDMLNGGAGNDVLRGDAGDDQFIFEDGTGADSITSDFAAGAGTEDVADLRAFGFSAFDDGTLNDVESALSQVGGNVVLQLDADDSVTFQGKTLADFDADDFIIV